MDSEMPIAAQSPDERPHLRMLTLDHIAADLHVSISTVYTWSSRRLIPHLTKLPNGDVRIREDRYHEWLVSLEVA